VSDAVADSLVGYPGPEPITIRNGVAVDEVTDARSSVRSEFGIGGHQHLIVHVGNIRPHKGHQNLIRTVSELTRTNKDIVVLSAGTEKHPGDLERLRELAASHGVSERIHFLGRRDDAHRLIAAADLLVNPSDVEGLPVVLLEAMKLGTPIVATDVGGVSSVIRGGETGWLVPPLEPTSLAAAIESALADPTSRSQRVEHARALVEAEYGIARMVTEFEELYDRILR
jgi:glycosyltransferase involved in cell wall biosynthesis